MAEPGQRKRTYERPYQSNDCSPSPVNMSYTEQVFGMPSMRSVAFERKAKLDTDVG